MLSVMSSKYPYTLAPVPLGAFLDKLKTVGVPDKINEEYLRSVGYGSSNHRAFVSVMKHIGLLDSNGTPNARYRSGLRGGDAGKLLVAEGIREGYKELFTTFPNAESLSTAELTTFIKSKTDLGDRALGAAVSTFQAVCKFGDFGRAAPVTGKETEREQEKPEDKKSRKEALSTGNGSVTINVNIALSVDATSDPSVYDAFFAAMAKHLKVLDGGSANSA